MQLVRWKALVPLVVFGALFAVGWWLFADRATRRAVEYVGAEVVGARVDVAAADLRLAEGAVRLSGLAVTNPEQPMRNLFEADEIVAYVRTLPLLEKKAILDTVAVRGLRFGTERRESGALARPSPTSGRIVREVSGWARSVRIPSLSLEALTGLVDVAAISPDSLRTLSQARAVVGQADSIERAFRSELAALDPRPRLDSARALTQRLREADPARLGIAGIRSLAESGRSQISSLDDLGRQVGALDDRVKASVASLQAGVQGLADVRARDLAWARGLLRLPSLDSPDLSPALFGDIALAKVQPFLYWLRVAEEYLPPGLDPRRRPGPGRVRASGTSVTFPRREAMPAFLLSYAAADLELGGTGAGAGRYAARLTGLTTQPAIYGRPMVLAAQRSGGTAGPRDVGLKAVLNHVARPLRDSVIVSLSGLTLAPVALPALGARLGLGQVAMQLSLERVGDSLNARMVWRTANASWTRDGSPPDPNARVGSRAWAEGLLWRTVSSLRSVELEARLSGSLRSPALAIRSNVGREVAAAMRRELGAQVAQAEARVRGEVDRLVQARVEEARRGVDALSARAAEAVSAQRQELTNVRSTLEAEIRRLTARLPIRIP
ncbi:MAG: hypothetical protein A2W29_06540 [Gemmatimonadetes bacterium RBG_16_66_8]|nr:MAG: hypothetical protein A2W29_06540 [Gemmatimonadetes bacterium RBG_16_66_8]